MGNGNRVEEEEGKKKRLKSIGMKSLLERRKKGPFGYVCVSASLLLRKERKKIVGRI